MEIIHQQKNSTYSTKQTRSICFSSCHVTSEWNERFIWLIEMLQKELFRSFISVTEKYAVKWTRVYSVFWWMLIMVSVDQVHSRPALIFCLFVPRVSSRLYISLSISKIHSKFQTTPFTLSLLQWTIDLWSQMCLERSSVISAVLMLLHLPEVARDTTRRGGFWYEQHGKLSGVASHRGQHGADTRKLINGCQLID